MLVRFWGTRGSIPVALTATDIREKIVLALLKADGRRFEDAEAANAFVRDELGFSVANTYGEHTPCVEIETGMGEYLVCERDTGELIQPEESYARKFLLTDHLGTTRAEMLK